jgi:hypothetical protein
VAAHKTEGPSSCITFLGILLDTVAQELRLPPEKIQRLQCLVRLWSSRKACTRKELESFLGHWCHAASVVWPGRTFLRELFNLLRHAKAPHHHIRLTAGARADVAWWKCFLQHWNGSSFFPLPGPSSHVFSDASGSYGRGAVADDIGWFKAEWPEGWDSIHISAKELVPVVVAAAIWGSRWAGKLVCFHSDNMAVVAAINSRIARDLVLMRLLRCSSFYCAYFKFRFKAEHVATRCNEHSSQCTFMEQHIIVFLSHSSYTTVPHSTYAAQPVDGHRAILGVARLFTSSLSEVSQEQH